MPGRDVSKLLSTSMWPDRSVSFTPAASRPKLVPRARGMRPTHARYSSALMVPMKVLSLECSRVKRTGSGCTTSSASSSRPLSKNSKPVMEVSSRTVMSSERRPAISRSAMVSSIPMRSSAEPILPRTTIVTSAPSLRKILEYSIAMIPLPTTTTEFGKNERPRLIESESRICLPSTGTPGAVRGKDPVQSNTFSASTVRSSSGLACGRTNSFFKSSSVWSSEIGSSVAKPCI
mmetsp:Transcript_7945/g.13431  ORF Transcript_7945/g.13431 Transcript_7945/m.13431 type:complete len:233 (-) Transcript_7945:538-1236(-)